MEVCKLLRTQLRVLGEAKKPVSVRLGAPASAAAGATAAPDGPPPAAADDLGALFDAAEAGHAGDVDEMPDIT